MTAATVFDPYDYAVQDDPYPYYTWLREQAPLYRNDEQDFWALSRHADVAAALRDDKTFSNRMGVTLDPASWGPQARVASSFLAMDPPEQTRLRTLVSKAFTPRRIDGLEDRIRDLTRRHLDALPYGDEFDFIDSFAGKLPMDVISEMLGVPEQDRAELRRLADLLIHRPPGMRDVPQEGLDAAVTLFSYFGELAAARRRRPGTDLVSALVRAEVDGDKLADGDIVGFAFLMIVAGNETTTKLLGNCLYWADRHPAVMADLLSDHTRVPLWVNETLRYDTSTQLLARLVTRDVEMHGTCAPAGSRLVLLLGSANRDPDVFADPDRYDLDRDTSAMVSFGGGRHWCLGANLARLEARVALSELLARAAQIEVDGERAQRVRSLNVRGFAHLPVRIRRR